MEERRDKRNIVYFIISYVINNLASGVLYDTFVNYLQEAQTSIATSFWAFYGYATALFEELLKKSVKSILGRYLCGRNNPKITHRFLCECYKINNYNLGM